MAGFREAMEALRRSVEGGALYTCEACGKKFGPRYARTCVDCDERSIREADAKRRAQTMLDQVDPRFRAATFASYACPPGDAAARDTVQNWKRDRGLYLCGTPGGGKSHLAFALARELVTGGVTVFAAEWTALLKRIKRTFDHDGETEADIWRAIGRADVVLVDDLMTGRERPTDWAVEQCWQLVQSRYASKGPLVFTANYDVRGLAQRIGGIDGERIASRLAEMCERVDVRAPDYRMTRRTA